MQVTSKSQNQKWDYEWHIFLKALNLWLKRHILVEPNYLIHQDVLLQTATAENLKLLLDHVSNLV